MDYIVKGLGEQGDLLTSPRHLNELTGGAPVPRASHATPDSLLIPAELAEALLDLPEHYDGHISGVPLDDEPFIWFGGHAYPLLPVACPSCGLDLQAAGFPAKHRRDGEECSVVLDT